MSEPRPSEAAALRRTPTERICLCGCAKAAPGGAEAPYATPKCRSAHRELLLAGLRENHRAHTLEIRPAA